MLEVQARSSSARILSWQPTGRPVETPTLIIPETSLGVPDWAEIVLTKTPSGRDIVEIASDGTWFHPEDVDGSLVLRAPRPGPTGTPQVVPIGNDVMVFHDAGGWAQDPGKFVEPFITAATEATQGRALYAPALGKPSDYAVYAYIGVDLFDASPLLLAATRGEALTVDGSMSQAEAQAIHGAAADDLVAFNLEQARMELANVRRAIRSGRIRHLAERRATNAPDTTALLRRFDHEWNHLESRAPIHDIQDVPCMTWDSLWMPEVERFRQRMRDDYTPPKSADTLVLLPCSARKPYRLSQTHRYFQRTLDDSGVRHRCHEVMVTSPLGVVPRELEEMHPANRYDVPVTGHWNRDEEAIIRQQVLALLDRHQYKHIVAHVGTGTWTFLRDLLPGAIHTAHGRPSSIEDCKRLGDELRRIQADDPGNKDMFAGAKARKIEDLQAALSMQFGAEVAAALCDGSTARGRNPYTKLLGPDGEQYGQQTEGRAFISLTLAGGQIVAEHGRKRVFQGDFEIRKTGSLFATGIVEADGDIRPGDDVVVMRGKEFVGVGVAQMTADELVTMTRGVGVQLRHLVKKEEVRA